MKPFPPRQIVHVKRHANHAQAALRTVIVAALCLGIGFGLGGLWRSRRVQRGGGSTEGADEAAVKTGAQAPRRCPQRFPPWRLRRRSGDRCGSETPDPQLRYRVAGGRIANSPRGGPAGPSGGAQSDGASSQGGRAAGGAHGGGKVRDREADGPQGVAATAGRTGREAQRVHKVVVANRGLAAAQGIGSR